MADKIFPQPDKPSQFDIVVHLGDVVYIHRKGGTQQAIDLLALGQITVANERAIAELRADLQKTRNELARLKEAIHNAIEYLGTK